MVDVVEEKRQEALDPKLKKSSRPTNGQMRDLFVASAAPILLHT